jgi:DNA mismatch repair ATPase MutL
MAARKRTTAPTEDTVSIYDACLRYMTTEQSLRLALSHVRPDDFDTVKAVSELDLEAIASHFQPKLPEVASSTSELPENSQNLTQQASEPATEQPQNTLSLTQQQQHLTAPTQSPSNHAQLTLIDQLAKQAGQEIELVDALAQVKNQLILNNLAVRDAELAEGINQHWQHQKQGYLGAIRDLASLAKEPVAITPDTTDLPAEVDQIIAELAKKLIV